MDRQELSPSEARDAIRGGADFPIRVAGKLDLSKEENLERLPSGLHCYDLDVSGTRVQTLPSDLVVENALVMDNCRHLRELPEGLKVGSLSLRFCTDLETLPEGIETWFVDLSGCASFERWPSHGRIFGGHVILRNCLGLFSLPDWMGPLAALDLMGCLGVSSIPASIRISSWLDLADSGIDSLPPHLESVSLRWNSVPITPRIAFQPETLSSKEILKESNAEMRRVMIERMGYLKFAHEAKAKVLDKDKDPGGDRQLLNIPLEGDEPLVGLVCSCPSTQRQYFLRVPPQMKKCHQAAAWIAGFDNPADYHPEIET